MNTLKTQQVLEEVLHERLKQNEKWGEQSHPDGTGGALAFEVAEITRRDCEFAFSDVTTDVGTWRHILDEEVAEAFAETEPDKLRAELVQVAAVAAAWIESIDRRTK
jgi:hypothetical protein